MPNQSTPLTSLAERFWPKVRKGAGCWEWQGARDENGYGRIAIDGRKRQKVRTHRVAWELEHGPIPEGIGVLHHCDNPPCCRGDHLYLGTHADNARDRDARGRRCPPRGVTNGRAQLAEADVIAIRRLWGLPGGPSQHELARQYGVSRSAICHILRRTTWTHVALPLLDAALDAGRKFRDSIPAGTSVTFESPGHEPVTLTK